MTSATDTPTAAKTVVLGQPGYGEVSAGASRGFWQASRELEAGTPLHLIRQHHCSSLLANAFNVLWCLALTLQQRGRQVDYFAMIHSDIEPQDFWLDTLIAELEERDLDILGVAVPIKSQHGLTSLALADPEGDNFRPKCRLTLRDVYDLPETFTSADVGYPLLLNTGLWVCRFDAAWNRQVHFEINDRITFHAEENVWRPEVEPEDWNFSRQCHALGLKIGATRKIPVKHAGSLRFDNMRPWGTETFDSHYLSESILTGRRQSEDGFRFPADVDGWLLEEEGRALAELAAGKRVLEIGSYCGRSTICLAQTAEQVTAVDTWNGAGTPRPRNTRGECERNLAAYDVSPKVILEEGVPAEGEYDLAFIDGDHSYEAVRADIERSLEVLAPEGLLAFHDYRDHAGQHDGNWDPGVNDAVDELIAAGGELISRHKTIAVVRPPASANLLSAAAPAPLARAA